MSQANDPIIPPTDVDPAAAGKEKDKSGPHAVELPAGTTEIDDAMTFEVEALAHAAASQVATEMAWRLDRALERAKAKPCLVLFLDERLATSLALHRAFTHQCEGLEGAFTSAHAIAEAGLAALRKARKEPRRREKREATVAPLSFLGPAQALSAAVNLLGFFRVDTSYFGREARVSQQALVMELARELLSRDGVHFRWPSLGIAPSLATATGCRLHLDRFHRLVASAGAAQAAIHQLAVAVHQLEDSDPRLEPARFALDQTHEICEPAVRLLAELREDFLATAEDQEVAPIYLVQLAEDVLAAGKASEAAGGNLFYLTARVESAGGSYRIRRHLWQLLFGDDPLAFSGGIVVSFALLDHQGDFVEAGTLRRREMYQNHAQAGTTFGQERRREPRRSFWQLVGF